MRRIGRVLGWMTGGGLALLLLALALLALGLGTTGGRRLTLGLIGRLTGGGVAAEGLEGRFPDHLRLARLRLTDAGGVWLEGGRLALDLDLRALLRGRIDIAALVAERLVLTRFPAGQEGGGSSSSSTAPPSFALPIPLRLRHLAIPHLVLGAEVAGHPLDLALEGEGEFLSLADFSVRLGLAAHGPPSRAALTLAIAGGEMKGHLALDDPVHGLAALWVPPLAPLPLHLEAEMKGPLTRAGLAARGRLGALDLSLEGPVDLPRFSADLSLHARSPDPGLITTGLSWREARLEGRIFGALAEPEAEAVLDVEGLRYAGAGAESTHLVLRAGDPALHAEATLKGLELPDPLRPLALGAPLTLEAVLPDRHAPLLRLALQAQSPLATLAVRLEEESGAGLALRGRADIPDLAPLGAAFGIVLGGSARLIAAAEPLPGGDARAVSVSLHLDLPSARAGALAPLGGSADLRTSFRDEGDDLRELALALASPALTLRAEGGLVAGRLALRGRFGLDPAASGLPLLQGPVASRFTLSGPPDQLTATLALEGRLAPPRLPAVPFRITAQAGGLPDRPAGGAELAASLAGAPLGARIAFAGENGGMRLSLSSLTWRSLSAAGEVRLAAQAAWPAGDLRLGVGRLADLDPLLGAGSGLALSGALDARLTGEPGGRGVHLELSSGTGAGYGLSWEGLSGRATLAGSPRAPVIDATLSLARLNAGAVPLRLRLEGRGGLSNLNLGLGVDGRWQNRPFAAQAQALLDLDGKRATLESLSGTLPGARIALAGPARLDFREGLALDRLTLSWGGARLVAGGRLAPGLDASLRLDDLTPALFTPFFPELAATGRASASAHLQGSPGHPEGRIEAAVSGLHIQKGDAAALPPADFHLEATLAGESARLEARLTAGRPVALRLEGRVPLSPGGAYALTTRGRLDLALLDPVLTAGGRRVGGELSLEMGVSGTRTAPALSGTASLSGGEFRDFEQGIDLHDIRAAMAGAGADLIIQSLSAKAGSGEITGAGRIGVFAAGLPVALDLHAVNASPLVSETLTERLDADLSLGGGLQKGLEVKGRIKVDRAEITIPDSLPPSVATIPVSKAGAPPPPPPEASAGPALLLDLLLEAPQAVFVHGRGIDAELGGRLHITGPAETPVLTGGLNLIRGQVTLGGTSLNFTSGHIGFEGGHRIDPALNLVATSSNGNVTATLTVGGFASDPKITLTSSPPLPQDEILAHLLFGTSASQLSAFQLASIAAGIAELSGATGGAGNAVNSVRSFLGLDRLTIGTPTNATPGPQAGPGSQQSVPTLEAGRYVAPGVYLGAKQSATGTNETAAELQINLGHGLRLDTTAGSGLGANSVGLSYQRQYGGGGN